MTLVIGGTGTVGKFLLLSLIEKNEKVIATFNKSKIENIKVFFEYNDISNQNFDKIIWVKTDISEKSKLSEIFTKYKPKIVYNCSGYVSLSNKKKENYYKVNHIGVRNIVDLCLENNVDYLCHLSSIATCSMYNGKELDENDLLDFRYTKSNYSISKFLGEQEVWRGIANGLKAVIVAPSVILAPYNINKRLLKYLMKNGIKFTFPGANAFVDINDVVESVQLLNKNQIVAQKYILSSENLTFNSLIELVNISLDKKIKLTQIPYTLIKVLNFLLLPLKIKNTFGYLFRKEEYSNNKLVNTLDYNFIPIDKTIKKIINYFKKNLENKK